MDAKFIETLLYRRESETLDFKVQQYPFAGATPDEQSELIKDVLAFANAWRDTDAYILIGVAEAGVGKSKVEGITNHLADHALQQFVNQRTQRPIKFQYHAVEIEGKQCGVIHIPVQDQRPFYLLKEFGKLKAFQVPIRRGSSTDFADPDEVAKMGKSLSVAISPGLEIEMRPSIKYVGPEVAFQMSAWLLNNPDGATAYDVGFHCEEIPSRFFVDHGAWEIKKSAYEAGKWISKNPLNPGERQPLSVWDIADAICPYKTVIDLSQGHPFNRHYHEAKFDNADWEFKLNFFAKDQRPMLFVCQFSREEIERLKTKLFQPHH